VSAKSSLTLIMFFWPRLTLAESPSWPIKQLQVGSELYVPVSPDWSGFYDWLRDNNGNLLGIRFSSFPETEFLIHALSGLPYTYVEGNDTVEIFLTSGRRRSVPERSCDQDFLYDQVFKSASGKHALAVCTDGLMETELRAISGADADWIAA
jgi:hypothetical protein